MLADEAASSDVRELRAGLFDAAAAELTVGALEAAARDEETT
jgi:hypothetical protein